MTEEQLMVRRALQEALDRRDNGGPPPEPLRGPESIDPSDQSDSASRDASSSFEITASLEVESEAESEVELEPMIADSRLGVPFPRVAA